MKKYDVIVVGGGLAGLTAAAYLSRAGVSTLLCEKRNKTGGLVETFRYQGFAFDAGIRAFENSGILFPMLKDLGIEMEYVKNEVSIGIEEQSVKLGQKDSLEPYIEMLKAHFPEEKSALDAIKTEIEKVMGYMDVLYGIDNPLFMPNMDPQYLMKTLLPWFLRYQRNIRKAMKLSRPIEEHLWALTQNKALIDMIIQHFFKETPAFFALSYFSLYLDYCYPKGGTGVLAEKMTHFITDQGGTVRTGCAVSILDSKMHHIHLESGEVFAYDHLIWAGDQRTLYNIVRAKSTPVLEKQRALSRHSKGGDSILTLFVALNAEGEYVRERSGAHMFYTPQTLGLSSLGTWQEAFREAKGDIYPWLGDYLERTTYEISCPVIRDSTLAPEGKSGLVVSTLLDYRLVKHLSEQGEYEQFKAFCTEKILGVLENSLFPGIKEMTLFSKCATPLTLEKETHNFEGAITGWAFTNPVMPAEHRFKHITKAVFTPITDVYQCGQWTFSPSGLPVSIVTGKLAADQVLKHQKKPKKV